MPTQQPLSVLQPHAPLQPPAELFICVQAAAIHGDLTQAARNAAIEGFRDGSTPLLVATDVAARGLDIPDVSLVINYSFPLTVEDYVHRVGRTGRAGQAGELKPLLWWSWVCCVMDKQVGRQVLDQAVVPQQWSMGLTQGLRRDSGRLQSTVNVPWLPQRGRWASVWAVSGR